jgi:hypothetical protein
MRTQEALQITFFIGMKKLSFLQSAHLPQELEKMANVNIQ